ncbi:MAG: hypothetical protein ACU0DI_01465 [Paracoccaceae bacterium]
MFRGEPVAGGWHMGRSAPHQQKAAVSPQANFMMIMIIMNLPRCSFHGI